VGWTTGVFFMAEAGEEFFLATFFRPYSETAQIPLQKDTVGCLPGGKKTVA